MANIPRVAKLKIAHCSNDHNLLNTPFSIMHLQKKLAHIIKSEWPLRASKHSLTKIHLSVNKTEILDGICLKIYLNLDIISSSKYQTKSEKQWDDKMTAHPIIEATISTLSERMPSHMVSGTAWSTALKNAPWEKSDKQTEHNLKLCFEEEPGSQTKWFKSSSQSVSLLSTKLLTKSLATGCKLNTTKFGTYLSLTLKHVCEKSLMQITWQSKRLQLLVFHMRQFS